MCALLNALPEARDRKIYDVVRLDVLDDRAVSSAGDEGDPKLAAQEGEEITGRDLLIVRHHRPAQGDAGHAR